MKRTDFRHLEPLRVRWAEIDAQGIVFNGHYLTYLDTAISGYWRALALPYAETMKGLGGDLYVRRATLDYRGSARYDDRLDVGIRCREFGGSSMMVDGAVFHGDQMLVQAETIYVFADPDTQSPVRLPDALRRVILDFEAGQPVVDVAVGPWSELGEAAGAIRREVFIEEQHIPADMEWDAADASCLHALARNRFGMPLATGRMLEHVPGVAKIGRMAVRRSMRGGQIGRQVLDALMAEARRQGYREVLLHAQLSAENFYLRAGFQRRGEPFEEAGIGHVEMVRAL
ncbi:YbgC/FadM family acyl-CoA thioesterase [Pelomonas sp. P7]|uniref:YbgC/FadM family acyl-CoA thioesterase n=1 Tax=Pelomonas caseinilytica TaxID=2906763 RepID=A0ABS8XE40_9BURK|nr:YbgC/FadM family acyl-CoA thioesterase [Pelomonas sp. P7]MCE4539177.1 YbgC/FadM family acyl-CoA thioesterase [Pelomonas sp. P7]